MSAIRILCVLFALCVSMPARAGIIFDNALPASDLFGDAATAADIGFTAIFRSDINQTIGGIGAQISSSIFSDPIPPNGYDIKFVLFDLGNGATPSTTSATRIYVQEKHFDTLNELYDRSDPLSVSLYSGQWYAVGVLSRQMISFFKDNEAVVTPGAGFTSFAQNNMNVWTYDDPQAILGGFGCCNIHYRLYSVPEPVTLALFGLGLAGLGFSRRGRFRGF